MFRKFKDWGDQYGSVYSLKIGVSTMVVLNDPRAVYELLNVRRVSFNDRPSDEQWDLVFQDLNFAIMHSNDVWRAVRKLLSNLLSPKILDGKLAKIQEAEVSRLMLDLLETPEEFKTSVQRTTFSTATVVLYGHSIPDWKSCWGSDFLDAIAETSVAIQPGSYLPTAHFPLLKLIPDSWVPSKRLAKKTHIHIRQTFVNARQLVDERRRNGDIRESLADQYLDGQVKLDVPLTDAQVDWTLLGTAHQAASETTASATMVNILLLATHKHVQEKAREELDRVCGTERMPQWSDAKDLPYITCIVKEGLRIKPVIPAGLPYRAKEDVWYEGMLIPKDATIVLPAWSLNYSNYANPSIYDPDRYVNHKKSSMDYVTGADYENRDHYTFGAGMRMCVGMHLADRTLWRTVARMLWAFRIEPPIDENGNLVELDLEAFHEGLVYCPLPYKVRFIPRSEKHAEVVRNSFAEVKDYLKQWE